jgi:hypothetical protein
MQFFVAHHVSLMYKLGRKSDFHFRDFFERKNNMKRLIFGQLLLAAAISSAGLAHAEGAPEIPGVKMLKVAPAPVPAVRDRLMSGTAEASQLTPDGVCVKLLKVVRVEPTAMPAGTVARLMDVPAAVDGGNSFQLSATEGGKICQN